MTMIDLPTAKALAKLGEALDELSKAWPDYFDIDLTVKLSDEPFANWHQEDYETQWFLAMDTE